MECSRWKDLISHVWWNGPHSSQLDAVESIDVAELLKSMHSTIRLSTGVSGTVLSCRIGTEIALVFEADTTFHETCVARHQSNLKSCGVHMYVTP
jgi:hypothetical protein